MLQASDPVRVGPSRDDHQVLEPRAPRSLWPSSFPPRTGSTGSQGLPLSTQRQALSFLAELGLGDDQMSHRVKVKVTQLCPTLCDPMDCSLPGSSVHGILQARILEWVAMPFSRESSQSRDLTWVLHNASRFFTIWATRKHMTHRVVTK